MGRFPLESIGNSYKRNPRLVIFIGGDTKAMPKKIIKWIEVEELRRKNGGHGVEFYHNDFPKAQSNPIAFIIGYTWLHKPYEEIPIRILKPNCTVFALKSLTGEKIINEVKEEIKYFLQLRIFKPGNELNGSQLIEEAKQSMKGKVRVWFNA